MEDKKKVFLLTEEEHLWDIAMRAIGIQLPDEYLLRFKRLLDLYGLRGLGEISLDDVVSIEKDALTDLNARIEKANRELDK